MTRGKRKIRDRREELLYSGYCREELGWGL